MSGLALEFRVGDGRVGLRFCSVGIKAYRVWVRVWGVVS